MHVLNLNIKKARVAQIYGREILDSRGLPALEVEMVLESGLRDYISIPSGMSVGSHEALELRDCDSERWNGKGLLKAIHNIRILEKALLGRSILNFKIFDQYLLHLDSTDNKSKFGANVILALSMLAIKLGAKSYNLPLYQYMGGEFIEKLPQLFVNVINGGAHADNALDFQEFMLVPLWGNKKIIDILESISKIFYQLKKNLIQKKYSIALGDEGGFIGNFKSNEEALDILLDSILEAGFIPGKDFSIALDIAANEFYDSKLNLYQFKKSTGNTYNKCQLLKYYENLLEKYPIISLEDPFSEDDENAWMLFSQSSLLNRIQIVGDDFFVTSMDRFLKYGYGKKMANSILLKPNQIGSIYETVKLFQFARANHYKNIISHRSGETEETFIVDLAVALQSDQVKFGSIARGERTAKYNRLLRIEEYLNLNLNY